MRFCHCDWCDTQKEMDSAEKSGWAFVKYDVGETMNITKEFCYCPECAKVLKTSLGNKPAHLTKLVQLSECMDELMGVVEEWDRNSFTTYAANGVNHYDSTSMRLKSEYRRIKAKYLGIAQRILENDE